MSYGNGTWGPEAPRQGSLINPSSFYVCPGKAPTRTQRWGWFVANTPARKQVLPLGTKCLADATCGQGSAV
ncbi:hypothetical protein HPB50_018237 [Hyalomma asiaticum]|uniref:Uncharacterized protein n=1 Tax=Hyalomma asiaticum TaxID=266040 RepID=A0ACB7SNF9_HYAAI|nr:hypothetical protein HPB50_018237 [Hyalomma asiaticum]